MVLIVGLTGVATGYAWVTVIDWPSMASWAVRGLPVFAVKLKPT